MSAAAATERYFCCAKWLPLSADVHTAGEQEHKREEEHQVERWGESFLAFRELGTFFSQRKDSSFGAAFGTAVDSADADVDAHAATTATATAELPRP